MYSIRAMWLIRTFWRLCGVFNIDLSHNKFQNVYSALLIATCVYNFANASQIIYKLDHWCSTFSPTLTAVYCRVLSSAVFFSRISVVYECEPNMSRYRATIRAFESYSPPSAAELRRHRAFSLAVVATCLVVIVPTNAISMYYLGRYENNSDASLFVYQLFMYVQNLSMCCIETQFVVQCFKVYTKFRGVNDDLKRLKDENINRSEYPFMSPTGSSSPSSAVVYDKDFYRPRFMSHPTANTVELLRIKHWLIRQSIDALNNLFGVHMGLSVFYLWLMALFDIYFEMFYSSLSGFLVYCWLLQYTLRLLLIILMAHFTTKQALESKSLITDISNVIMDSSTKEEIFAEAVSGLPDEILMNIPNENSVKRVIQKQRSNLNPPKPVCLEDLKIEGDWSLYEEKQFILSDNMDLNHERVIIFAVNEELRILAKLQLFINQISSSTTEFNAYDFFTLNTQVIKSAIAAGATCLVILVQFHSERK